MSLNGIALYALADELRAALIGARIEKVYQEEKDISIKLRSSTNSLQLKFAFSGNTPAVYTTTEREDFPKEPPMFCMLLRKYLIGTKLISINQSGLDRVLFFTFSPESEYGLQVDRVLAFELMGKYSNLILFRKDSQEILDALIRVYPDMSSVRLILPGETYRDLSTGENPLARNRTEREEIFLAHREMPTVKILLRVMQGLNPETVSEICRAASIDGDMDYDLLHPEDRTRLHDAYDHFLGVLRERRWSPTVYLQNGRPKKISPIPLDNTYGESIVFPTMMEAVRNFYQAQNSEKLQHSRKQELLRTVHHKIESCQKKLQHQEEDRRKAEDREQYKMKADLLAANIYAIEKGASSITVQNFYDPNMNEIQIRIDPLKSPKENVRSLYHIYKKKKQTEVELNERIPETMRELEYLLNVRLLIARAETLDDIFHLKQELRMANIIRGEEKRKMHVPKRSPKQFTSPSGYTVLAGRDNIQNDELTFRISRKDDLWFHVKNAPGTHVVLRRNGQDYTEDDILFAACIAARESGFTAPVAVDYTEIRNVKKRKGPQRGLVTYTDQKTLHADPQKLDAKND